MILCRQKRKLEKLESLWGIHEVQQTGKHNEVNMLTSVSRTINGKEPQMRRNSLNKHQENPPKAQLVVLTTGRIATPSKNN